MSESTRKSEIDRSEGSSSPSTLPDMEHVSPTSSSSTLAGGNPFLEDVVKPFLDYGTSRSSEKKGTSERRKGGDNPFQPAERGRAGRSRAGSDVGSSHVLKEGRGKSEEAKTGYSLEGRQPELSSSGTHPSDEVGGEMEPLSLDSGVELQFTALMQLLEQPDMTQSGSHMVPKEGKETRRLPPQPPARTTSLAKADSPKSMVEDNEVPKQIPNNDREEETSDTQPLCLSADTMRRFAVDYEVEEITDESLEDLEIVQACKQQPAALGTSDFDLSDDDLSESDEKEEEEDEEKEEETTFDFIPMGNSDEISQGKPNDLEDYVGITSTVGNDRDSAVPQFACTQGVSRDPAQADSEARLDPGESAATGQHRLSADSQSSLLASQHSVRLIPACHAVVDGHQSKSRSRSQLQPDEASEFLNEEMRINMPQPVYSEAHHQVT